MTATMMAFIFALVLAAPVIAHGQSSEEARRTYQRAIVLCVADVRKESAAFSKFDMYLTKAGELRGWGTDHEMYLFNKCMEQLGYDTQVQPRPKGDTR